MLKPSEYSTNLWTVSKSAVLCRVHVSLLCQHTLQEDITHCLKVHSRCLFFVSPDVNQPVLFFNVA